MRSFASDNNSGVHPDVMAALTQANQGHAVGYGDDRWTDEALQAIQGMFGPDTDAYFVFLGTGANALAIKALTQSYHAVLLTESAHANVDECGAPELVAGCKLAPVPAKDGKMSVDSLAPFLHHVGFEHSNQPRLISITQPTELGTVYQPEDIRAIADFAHKHGMLLHMDGARLANAAASLGCSMKELTVDLGVDALSLGGAKNGMMYGEAVLFFDPALSRDFRYIRKQGMQLASKMRFISAQFTALLSHDLWRRNAQQANSMATRLAEGARALGIEITRPVETNHVFAVLPQPVIDKMLEKHFFYVWNPELSEVRWVTSFDTTEEDVQFFLASLKHAMEACEE